MISISMLMGAEAPPPVPANAPRRVNTTVEPWVLPDAPDESDPDWRQRHKAGQRTEIYAWLTAHGPHRSEEVATALCLSVDVTSRRLREMEAEGQVTRARVGRNVEWEASKC